MQHNRFHEIGHEDAVNKKAGGAADRQWQPVYLPGEGHGVRHAFFRR